MENSIKTLVLKEIKKNGNIRLSCDAAKIHHSKFYRECDRDPVFRAKVKQAKADYILRSD